MVPVLAIETSSRRGSVALADGADVLDVRRFSQGMRHAAELMPAIRDLMRARGLQPGDLAQVYVSLGPGSFTGLRIAVAVARSLHQALGCRLVGVPTLDVIARNAPAGVGNLVVMLDAKRKQVFAARYARGAGEGLVRVEGPALVFPADAVKAARAHGVVHLAGEGLDYHREALAPLMAEDPAGVVQLPSELWPPTAEGLHALGWLRAREGRFTPPAELLPIYIRLAEAEELWRKRQGMTQLTVPVLDAGSEPRGSGGTGG